MDAQVTVKCSVCPSQQTLSKLGGANKIFSENLFYIWNKVRPCQEAHPFFQVDLSSKTFFESPQCGLNQRRTESQYVSAHFRKATSGLSIRNALDITLSLNGLQPFKIILGIYWNSNKFYVNLSRNETFIIQSFLIKSHNMCFHLFF